METRRSLHASMARWSASRSSKARKGLRKLEHRDLGLEPLEARQLLAIGPQLVALLPNEGADLLPGGLLPAGVTRNIAPREFTFRFNDGQVIDATTLGGIRITASGGDGIFGNGNDIPVDPIRAGVGGAPRGFIGLGNFPNEVVLRFAETIPDDLYHIDIIGTNTNNPLKNTAGELFNNGIDQTITLDLDLGTQIVGVVPQPVRRVGAGLVQDRDLVEVYFNANDPPNPLSAEDETLYKLIFTGDTATTTDDVAFTPLSAIYSFTPAAGATPAVSKVVLDFGPALHTLPLAGAGTFRLHLGDNAPFTAGMGLVNTSAPAAVAEIGNDFTTVTDLLTLSGSQSLLRTAAIDAQPYTIPWPGADTDPGNREMIYAFPPPFGPPDPLNGHLNGSAAETTGGVTVMDYNFRPSLGTNIAGTFPNNITENQKQRAREILEMYSYYSGIQFRETATSGFTIATGDVRAMNPILMPVGGPAGIAGTTMTDLALNAAIMNETGSFGISEFGGGWFTLAMHEIGHILGLGHTYETPSVTIMGDGSPLDTGVPAADPVYPGDADVTHIRALYRPDVKDIDLYRFQLNSYGQFSAETIAERLATPSQLDSVVTLYEEIDTLRVPAGSITAALNGKTFTILDDLATSVTFEFENDGSVGGGNIGITFVAGTTTPAQLATAIAAAINNQGALRSDAVASGDTVKVKGLITLTPGGGLPLVHRANVRDLIARNDDYYSEDSYLDLRLSPAIYYVAITSTGNTNFDPEIVDSGIGGTTQGNYTLRVNFVAETFTTLVDNDGPATILDGDGDGRPGGLFDFWFKVANEVTSHTIFVDKAHVGVSDGSEANPYTSITAALADVRLTNTAVGQFDILRIVGNDGADANLTTPDTGVMAYEIGVNTSGGGDLGDGRRLDIPRGVTTMIDAGAVFKLRQANITAGSTAQGVNRSESHLQVLGTPLAQVYFSSFHDESMGVDTLPGIPTSPARGDWGGLVVRNDLDLAELNIPAAGSRRVLEQAGIFLNYINGADIRYGGGQVVVNSQSQVYQPIYMDDARPTITHNIITNSADSAMSADPASFVDEKFQANSGAVFTADYERVGPEIHGNRLAKYDVLGTPVSISTASNTSPITITTNGGHGLLTGDRVRVENVLGNLGANGEFIVTVVNPTTFVLNGSVATGVHTPNSGTVTKLNTTHNSVNGLTVRIRQDFGTPLDLITTTARFDDTDITHILTENLFIQGTPGGLLNGAARQDARLTIDPGTVLKLEGARIEVGFGAQLLAEGTTENDVVFTSLRDDRYGFGGTFDTNGNFSGSSANPGDWGGIFFGHTSTGGIDHALLTFGGGNTRIEGGFDRFNVVEIHQSDVRIANSTIERNSDGASSTNRVNRQANTAATVFVRGSQPVLLNNIIRDNNVANAPAISINVNSLQDRLVRDIGRATGVIDAYTQFNDNFGPLVRLNRLGNDGLNGMRIRGGNLTTASVWDDTDIVHIVLDTIQVVDFHHYGGLRLQSGETEALVVKLLGNTAGFTANGLPLDINDRIGGTIHIVGTTEYPVVLTSLNDDTVGAGLTAIGQPMMDTDNDGAASPAAPGQWRSVRMDKFSNDRNSGIVREVELPYTGAVEANGTAATAQPIGTLAGDQKSGDDNRRLGFEVQGTISWDDATDVDVYSFQGVAGSEVWLDIDNTTHALDTVVELILNDGSDTVVARSINGMTEATANGWPTTPIANAGQPGVGMPAIPVGTNIGRSMRRETFRLPDTSAAADNSDFFTTNPRDAGMRLILPGSVGSTQTYFVRVRSNSPTINTVKSGISRGSYDLQVRIRELDEFPGSTIRYADLRFGGAGAAPAGSIELLGVPSHSPLVGDSRETTAVNDAIGNAQPLGNMLQYDRGAIAVAGAISAQGDIDWFDFTLNITEVQSVAGVNSGPKTWATVFDVDYSDGLTRANTFFSVFAPTGGTNGLIFIGTDSNIADDQPDPAATVNTTDLSRGTFGPNDPFIGPIQLPTGTTAAPATYRVAMSTDQRLPTALDQFFVAAPATTRTRLEPVTSINKIWEDRITYSGGSTTPVQGTGLAFTGTTGAALQTYAAPFTLSDVTLFVMQSGATGRLRTIDPFTGANETDIADPPDTGTGYGDLAMRNDGRLVSLTLQNTGTVVDTTTGNYRELDSGTGAQISSTDDNINVILNDATTPGQVVAQPNRGIAFNAMAFSQATGSATGRQLWAVGNLVGSNAANSVPPTATQQFNLLYQFNPDTGVATGPNGTANTPISNPHPAGAGGGAEITGLVAGGAGGEFINGLAFIGGTMFGASSTGNLYSITTGGAATLIANIAGVNFTGMTPGPETVQGGAFANLLFTTDTGGRLRAFNTAGVPQPIFVGGATSVAMGIGSVVGLAFSTLDYNLWHLTDIENGVVGHGVETPPDNSARKTPPETTNRNWYFGLENPTSRAAALSLGVTQPDSGAYTSNNTLFQTYNLPGGAHGALTTNTFSLTGYSPEDKPTLYFTYLLQSEGAAASGTSNAMRDAARVYISTNGGTSWNMIATNNSAADPQLDAPGTPLAMRTLTDSELPEFLSFSETNSEENNADGAGLNARQRRQELFDTNNWRQARIPLADFAGQASLMLRFDFTTAGDISDVNAPAGSQYAIGMTGDSFGNFASPTRGTNNAFRGFMVDDIIIGFAERGEMVTSAPNDVLGHSTRNVDPSPDFQTVPQGEYQLDIRRGVESGEIPSLLSPNPGLSGFIDTNGRYVQDLSLNITALPTNGQTFTLSDGVNLVTLRFATVASVVTDVTIGGTTAATAANLATTINNVFNAGLFRITAKQIAPTNTTVDLFGAALVNEALAGLTPVTWTSAGVRNFFNESDRNEARDQGMVIVQQNRITQSANYGIRLDEGAALNGGSTTFAGPIHNLRQINNQEWVPGAVVENNVVNGAQVGGILVSGSPAAAVSPSIPFSRILNNTIFGAAVAAGIGIDVTDRASPTILNNIVSNLATGVRIDATSQAAGTVLGGTVYKNNTTNANTGAIGVGSFPIQMATNDALFVDPLNGNFYLAAGSIAIDSSIESVPDRPALLNVYSEAGIGQSNILAPPDDNFGNQRVDDPTVSPVALGLGANVFIDRGAIERVNTITINDVTVTEGNAGIVNAVFTVTLTRTNSNIVTVVYNTTDITTIFGADYNATSGTLTFNPGASVQTVTVQVVGDTIDEINETFRVNLFDETDAVVADSFGVGTITDDDLPPELSVQSVTVVEGDIGLTTMIFTLDLTSASGQVVTVNFGTAPGPAGPLGAQALIDYQTTNGVATFTPGFRTTNVTVQVIGDTTVEADETFFLNLTGLVNATFVGGGGTLQTTGVIRDDDAKINVFDAAPNPITNPLATIDEPNPPFNNNAVFEVRISGPSPVGVSVIYTINSGVGPTGATAGVDFQATTGTLNFTGATTNLFVTVPVFGDLIDEFDESFTIDLSGPTNAVIQDGQGLAIIHDPAPGDPQPQLSIANVTSSEGDVGPKDFVFTVTLSPFSGKPVTVAYTTAPDSASAGSDYNTTSGTLTFNPGQTTQLITVQVVGDGNVEPNERFFVNLSSPGNALINDGSADGIITDDEPIINIADAPAVLEGNPTPASAALFVVSLDLRGKTSFLNDISVSFVATPGTASAGDFTPPLGSPLVFSAAATETVKTITVPIVGDTSPEPEPDETFTISLTNLTPGFANDGDMSATGTIIDDEPRVSIAPAAPFNGTLAEGNPPSMPTMVFNVSLNRAGATDVTVVVTDSQVSATAGSDYTFTDQTLTFTGTTVVLPVTATVVGDLLDETNETFTLNLSNVSGGVIVSGQDVGTGTIADDDGTPQAFIAAIAGMSNREEGNTGTSPSTPFVFAIQLDAPSGQPVTVGWRTVSNTASSAANDFTAVTAGVEPFAAGETSRNVTVQVTGDTILETNESFFVDVVAAGTTNATLLSGQTRATGDILDDEPRARIVPAAGPFNESSGSAVFTVELVHPITGVPTATPVSRTVNITTSPGTATAGQDYNVATNPTSLVFSGATTAQQFTVVLVNDTKDEPSETFQVNISGEANLVLASGATATGTIQDDDPEPTMSISGTTAFEADSTISNATFNVVLGAESGKTITVQFFTSNLPPGPFTAQAGSDYNSTVGTLTFLPGQTSKVVTVQVLGDLVGEFNENFLLNLASPVNAVFPGLVSTIDATGTIIDNEPRVSIGDRTIVEGSGTTVNADFAVTLSKPSDSPVQVVVNYTLVNGTAIGGGQDFGAGNPATVVFNPGETLKTLTVPIVGDLLDEDDETYTVDITSATNSLVIDGQGQGLIIDNDALPTISIADAVPVTEDTPGAAAVFTVSLNAPSGREVRVVYNTANQTPGPGHATGGFDYNVFSNQTLTFAAGVTALDITVPVILDNVGEPNETFLVNLSAPVNATLGTSTATGTIVDDEPRVSISDNLFAPVNEADAGTQPMVFEITLDRVYGEDVNISYVTVAGTATSPADYVFANATTIIPFGQTAVQITVNVQGDLLDEADETFFVNLTAVSTNAVILDGQGQGTIVDNDVPPSVVIFDQTVVEGNSGTTDAVFTVQLNTPSGLEVRVPFATADGSATVAANDFNPNTGVVTFLPGQTSRVITVQVRGDTLGEANENFLVNLTASVDNTYLLADNQAIGNILDDEPRISIADLPTIVEANGTVNAVFTITLTPGQPLRPVTEGGDITVAFATAAITATAGVDYQTTSGVVTFQAGLTETVKQITVPILGDTLDELDETFVVNLSGQSANSVMLDGQASATIQDEDSPPTISIGDMQVIEGHGGTTNLVFPVTLNTASGLTVGALYSTADGTTNPAFAGVDYVSVSGGVVTFAPGQTVQNITIQVIGDRESEVNETLQVNLSTPSNASIADGQGIGTILDDEPLISITPVTVTESNVDVNAVFLVQMDRASAQSVVVTYLTQDISAVSPGDYTGGSGAVTFLPGQVQTPLTVVVKGDLLNESAETFQVTLTGVTSGSPVPNASIVGNTAIGTINNDDPLPSIFIGTPTPVTEPDNTSSLVPMTFPVTLSAVSGQTVSVPFSTVDLSATSGSGDYDTTTGTLVFAPGEVSKDITVQVRGDTLGEPNETFLVQLGAPVNGTLGSTQATGTILDNEPRVAVNDAIVNENGGTAVFPVILTGSASGIVSVTFSTAPGTAVAGSDYTTTSGTVSFLVGETSKAITVQILEDLLDEGNETFNVNLTSSSSNSVVTDASGLGTIVDNDNPPSLVINDASIVEGDSGSTDLVFNVVLSSASGQGVTVNFATTPNTAATPADFQTTSGVVSFSAGSLSRTITVRVVGDTVGELDETFTVTLSSPSNATLSDASAVGTIQDDDPRLFVSDVTVTEGVNPTYSFVVSLTEPAGSDVTVVFATANVTATAGADYQGTSGTLTFSPGQTVRQVVGAVFNDALDENDETFVVNLTNGSTQIIDSQAMITIVDDDPLPSVSIDSVSVTEPDSGVTNAVFTVTLSPASGRSVSVDFTTANITAAAGSDYAALSGTLVFAAGELQKVITVQVNGDLVAENNETFQVGLSNVVNASIGTGSGIGTIVDNEPRLSVNDVTIVEPDSGATNAVFTVSINRTFPSDVVVLFSTANGSADSSDYQGTSGTLTIASGSLTAQVTVPVLGDSVEENNETFFVNLSSPTNAVIFDGQGVGNILDNDPRISINSVTVAEGNSSFVQAIFTVSLSKSPAAPVSVVFNLDDVTAVGGADYTDATGSVSFAVGETQKTITVNVLGDTLDEVDETFNVTLSSPVNGVLLVSQGVGTITDNDNAPLMSIGNISVVEGNVGTGNTALFSVVLNTASGQVVTVNYTTNTGSATGADFVSTSGVLTFQPGQVTQNVSVQIIGDTLDESNEVFSVDLSGAVNASITTGQGLGTIQDDDAQINISDVTVTETNSGSVSAIFNVTLSKSVPVTVVSSFATANGTATAPADYTAASGNVTFSPNQTLRQITVQVLGDVLNEADETFLVNLTGVGANGQISDGVGQGTIVNNDPQPALSVNDVTVSEGNNGLFKDLVFTVSLTPVSGQGVTVNYTLAAGSATPDVDYNSGSGSISFAAGVTTQQVTVQVIGDNNVEVNETFTLNLNGAVNATVADGQGTGVIANDDLRHIYVVGNDAGIASNVKVYEGGTGVKLFDLSPYGAFAGGVRVAAGDVDADGVADFITAPGKGGKSDIRVYSGQTGTVIRKFTAFETSFLKGVHIAAGDVDGDGRADIIVGTDGEKTDVLSRIRVFSGATGLQIGPQIDLGVGSGLNTGVRVAAGDTTGDGRAEVIVGANPGVSPRVTVFDVANGGAQVASFLAYEAAFQAGVHVAGGDFNGDGIVDIITGTGRGGGPYVRVFNGLNPSDRLANLTAYSPDFKGGVRVGATDYNGDGLSDIVTGAGPGGGSHVRVFSGIGLTLLTQTFSEPGFFGGIFVGGSFRASGDPLQAAGGGVSGGNVNRITQADVQSLVNRAIADWAAAGLSSEQLAKLSEVEVRIADLPGAFLGKAYRNAIVLDANAAGHGWFVDPTPDLDEEYDELADGTVKARKASASGMDLLSVIAHELGHTLGLKDINSLEDPDDLMADVLSSGIRRRPSAGDVDAVFGNWE